MELQSYLKKVDRHLQMPRPGRTRILSDFRLEVTKALGETPGSRKLLQQSGSPREAALGLRQAHPQLLYRKVPG